ncbi:MAG: N-acetylneuraminate synthase family protein [Thermoleophilaceae bacterium]
MARFIVEIGSNHNRDLERTYRLLEQCAAAGAQAAKLQLFRVEELFAPEALAFKPSLRDRREWELPLDMLEPVRAKCTELGLELGVTPFSRWAVDVLAPHVDFLKVASYELLWHDLIRDCAATGKPLLVSTGMATLDEITAAVDAARSVGCSSLTLMHCVSGYPTPPEQCNLAAIDTLFREFRCDVGWSDHSRNAAVVARAVRRFAASDIEAHVDLDEEGFEAGEHNWGPEQLREAIELSNSEVPLPQGIEVADGDGEKRPMPVERADVPWRADPADGLRPLAATRAALV